MYKLRKISGLMTIVVLLSMCLAGCDTSSVPFVGKTSAKDVKKEVAEALPGIICWGDSLTFGYNGEGSSYPNTLANDIKEDMCDIPVVNMGACGEDSLSIAGRSGGIPLVVSEDFTIPSDTTEVSFKLSSKDGRAVKPLLYTDVGINECSIAGVKGTIRMKSYENPADGYLFKRTEVGSEQQVKSGEKITTFASKSYRNYISIVFVGTNGGYDNLDDLIKQQKAIINSRTKNTDRYLIVGLTSGSAKDFKEFDKVMKKTYKDKYFNLREYLTTDALKNANITPTTEDEQYMKNGVIPPSLRSDAVHYNKVGYEQVGHGIYEKLDKLGYFDGVKKALKGLSKEERKKISQEMDEKGTKTLAFDPTRKDAFKFAANLGPGINIGNSLDCHGSTQGKSITAQETSWGLPKVSKAFIKTLKKNGFKSVRIPITWEEHINGDGDIDAKWLNHVKEVVDYAYSEDMYVVIDIHHDSWVDISTTNFQRTMGKGKIVWKQIANKFKNYDDHLIFEGFNEVRLVGTDLEWGLGNQGAYDAINVLNKMFVETVRSTKGNNATRYLIVSGYRDGSDDEILKNIAVPDDSHIMVAVHSYDPYKFAAEGENGTPVKDGVDTWDANNVEDKGSIDHIVNNVKTFSQANNVPVIMTELGAVDKNNEASRVAWCNYYIPKLKEANVPYMWWDNGYVEGETGKYGLFDRNTNKVVFKDLLETIK
ncbi:Aryl-phospho-beta-D-glucosidase BglC, GH1 family [Lachnospiraceae bacterium C7]|nr:Aryl-phospho-beta-D-glucosidase BglC, GH1 family [Lachnospiraceae bacterium C7]